MEAPRDAWRQIAVFTAITYGVSSIFMYLAIEAGSMGAYNGSCAMGGMWSPFLGLVATRLIFGWRRSGGLRGLGWTWGKTRYQIWSYFLPFFYVLGAHLALWLAGFGGFTGAPAGTVAVFVLKRVVLGATVGSAFALGEEIGWSGFLVPKLARLMSFTGVSFTRGIIWSVWHYPLIIGGAYGPSETPLPYRLLCFTIVLTGVSFAFTWFRIRSGSLWTGMFLHAGHNIFIQSVLPGVTVDRPATAYFIDEFGAFSAAAAILVAIVFWRMRARLEWPDRLARAARGPLSG